MSRYLNETKQRAGALGGNAYAAICKRRSAERIAAARAHAERLRDCAVPPRRAEQLKHYWRRLAKLEDSPLPPELKRVIADDLYREAFPGEAR